MTRGRSITYEQRVRARELIARADARIKSDLEKVTKEILRSRPKTSDQMVWQKTEEARIAYSRNYPSKWSIEVDE